MNQQLAEVQSVPYDRIAEESLLGAMMLSRDVVDEVAPLVTADHFYKPTHGHVFEAIVAVWSDSEAVNAVSVSDALRKAGLLDVIGGPAVLLDYQSSVPQIHVDAAKGYAKIVVQMSLLRQLATFTSEAYGKAMGNPADPEKLVADTQSALLSLTSDVGRTSKATAMQLMDVTLTALEERYEALDDEELEGIRTGFHELDDKIGGLKPGGFYVIGARPAMGKSALAMNIATHVAMHTDVLFFSLEMSNAELGMRILSAQAEVDSISMRDGELSDDDWQKITNNVKACAELKLTVDDNPMSNTMSIRSAGLQAHRKSEGGIGLIVVDYIQLLEGSGKYDGSRQLEVSDISRQLKILARELGCAVIALAQLNRGLEQRTNKRPMLSDLRESGSLEQDADVVLFIYRDEVYNPDSQDVGLAEVIVAKNRSGPGGTVRLGFRGEFTKFNNISRRIKNYDRDRQKPPRPNNIRFDAAAAGLQPLGDEQKGEF